MVRLVAIVLFGLIAGCQDRPKVHSIDFVLEAEAVDPAVSAIRIVRLEDGTRWESGGERITQRFTPASTAKIPHTVLALELGAVSSPREIFEWDGVERFAPQWNKTQTFTEAFHNSTVWIYQQVTPRIGHAAINEGLASFAYGNADIGPPERLQDYWLVGPLAVSAAEQVTFLSKLQRQEFPLSSATYSDSRAIMRTDGGDDWSLYAKTGWKFAPDNVDIGWYVGWLEQRSGAAAGTYVFAFNMDMIEPETDRAKRRSVVVRALAEIGVDLE